MLEWGQKSRPKKTPRASKKNPKIPGPNINPPKISHVKFLSVKFPERGNDITRLRVLNLENYAVKALNTNFYIVFNTSKKSLLKSSHTKKFLSNYPTQENPRIKIFQPKKILRSSPSLEIPSTPLGLCVLLKCSEILAI